MNSNLSNPYFFVLTGRGTKFPENSRLQDQCSFTEKRSYQISSLHPRSRYFAERTKAVVSCSVLQTDRRATILQFQEDLKSRTNQWRFHLSLLVSKATVSLSVCSFRAECKGHTDPTCLSSAHCSNATTSQHAWWKAISFGHGTTGWHQVSL